MYQDQQYFLYLAKAAGMDKDPWVENMIKSPSFYRSHWRSRLEKILLGKISPRGKIIHPYNFPNREEAQRGSWPFGRVITIRGPEYDFLFDPTHLNRPTLIAGPTRSGKTVALYLLSMAAHRGGIKLHWLDTEDEMAALVANPSNPATRDFLIIDYKNFRQNIFRGPPGATKEWITRVTHLFRESHYFRDGAVSLVRQLCGELNRQKGDFNLRDVYEGLLRLKFRQDSRTAGYWETARRALHEIMEFMSDTYDTMKGHDLPTILNHSVVWRLRNLSPDLTVFFVNNFLHLVAAHSGVTYDRQVQNIFVFDEITRIVNTNRMARTDTSELFLLDAVRALGKRRLSLLIATQTPNLLPRQVLGNIGTWIVFRPADGYCLDIVSRSLALNAAQRSHLMRLGEREAIVKTPNYSEPFPVELPEVDLTPATWEQVKEREAESMLAIGPADSFRAPGSEQRQLELERGNREKAGERAGERAGEEAEERAEEKPQGKPLLSTLGFTKKSLDYLVIQAKDPFTPVSKRDKKNGISSYMGNNLRKEQDRDGLITLHRIPTGIRGKVLTCTQLTEKGYMLLDLLEERVQRPKGNGSYEHKWSQNAIYNWAVKRGYPARIEEELGGKRVDVGISWDEKRVAVEFVNDMNEPPQLEKELRNLDKDLERGWDEVVFCASREETLQALRELIKETFKETLSDGPEVSERVKFMKLSSFIE